jgi:hypothetical protein
VELQSGDGGVVRRNDEVVPFPLEKSRHGGEPRRIVLSVLGHVVRRGEIPALARDVLDPAPSGIDADSGPTERANHGEKRPRVAP